MFLVTQFGKPVAQIEQDADLDRVTGDAEIYSLDANGLPVLAQSEVILKLSLYHNPC